MPASDHGEFVWIDGRIAPAAEARVSVFDRGFLYGDSLFESVLVRHGRPFRWDAHVGRMQAGAAFLRIEPPAARDLGTALESLLRANAADRGSVRVTLSRGTGRRGYSPRGAGPPTLVLAWHDEPAPGARRAWRLATSPFRVAAADPVAAHKHGSKILNVLSRAAAEEAGADESLLLDTAGQVAETSGGNLFLLRDDSLCTPPVSGLLAGVTRRCIVGIAPELGLRVRECPVVPADLFAADAVFFTTSSLGVIPVASLDGAALGDPTRCETIARALDELVERECRMLR